MATTRKQLKKLETAIKTEQNKKPVKSARVGVVMGAIPSKEAELDREPIIMDKLRESYKKAGIAPNESKPTRFEPIDSLPGSPGFTSFGMKPRKKLHLQFK